MYIPQECPGALLIRIKWGTSPCHRCALAQWSQHEPHRSRVSHGRPRRSVHVFFCPQHLVGARGRATVGLLEPMCSASRAETGIGQVKTHSQRRPHVDIKALLILQAVDEFHGRFRRQSEENRTSDHDKPADQSHHYRQCAPDQILWPSTMARPRARPITSTNSKSEGWRQEPSWRPRRLGRAPSSPTRE
jgi:hypothetical protein